MSESPTPLGTTEKDHYSENTHALGRHGDEVLGDLQVLKLSDSQGLKLTADGKTVLIPQPSDDPEGKL
jgi:hypothetical protein